MHCFLLGCVVVHITQNWPYSVFQMWLHLSSTDIGWFFSGILCQKAFHVCTTASTMIPCRVSLWATMCDGKNNCTSVLLCITQPSPLPTAHSHPPKKAFLKYSLKWKSLAEIDLTLWCNSQMLLAWFYGCSWWGLLWLWYLSFFSTFIEDFLYY